MSEPTDRPDERPDAADDLATEDAELAADESEIDDEETSVEDVQRQIAELVEQADRGELDTELAASDELAGDDEELVIAEMASSEGLPTPTMALRDAGPSDDTLRVPKVVALWSVVGLVLLFVAMAYLILNGDNDAEPELTLSTSTTTVVTTTVPEPTPTNISDEDLDQLIEDYSSSQTRVMELEDELAAAPLPAQPGVSMYRIGVSGGANFIDAVDNSVSVLSEFGSYANIDPATDSSNATVQVGESASAVLRTGSSMWSALQGSDLLVRVDPVTNEIAQQILSIGPTSLAKFDDTLLVGATDGTINRIAPGPVESVGSFNVGGPVANIIVATDGTGWAALPDSGEVVRFDPEAMTETDRFVIGAGARALAESEDGLWVANADEGTAVLINPETGVSIATVETGGTVHDVAVGLGRVWVSATDRGQLLEIDPGSNEVVASTPLGGPGRNGGPQDLVITDGSVWVAMAGENSVVRITPAE